MAPCVSLSPQLPSRNVQQNCSLYTAVTRAREELIIICEPDRRDSVGTLTKAARNPRIKGNTLEEKLGSGCLLPKRCNNGNQESFENGLLLRRLLEVSA